MVLEGEKIRKMLDDAKAGGIQFGDLVATLSPLNKGYLDDVLKRKVKTILTREKIVNKDKSKNC